MQSQGGNERSLNENMKAQAFLDGKHKVIIREVQTQVGRRRLFSMGNIKQ